MGSLLEILQIISSTDIPKDIEELKFLYGSDYLPKTFKETFNHLRGK